MFDIRCADVEILPNFFSITFVSLNDYLKVFADCVNDKGKPIPLVQKLSVKEIKERLDKVKSDVFYITDKDDSQLIPLLDYFTKMRVIGLDTGNRVNLYTYNGMSYDNLMIAAFLIQANHFDNTKDLIKYLYNLSKKIIDHQDDKEYIYKDQQIRTIKQFALPYIGIDVMRIFALNKVGTIVDKNNEKKYVPKGLKQVSINLQWYELLEYEIPPICDKDKELYWDNPMYKGLPPEKLNKLIDKWDRFILDEYISDMCHYNKNDVFIVCEIVRLNPEEIKSRYAISSAYKVDVLNSSRSNIADIMFTKFYSEFSNLPPEKWKGKKTIRTKMNLGKIIFDCVKFKSAELNRLLEKIRKTTVTRVSKEEFNEEVKIGNTIYSLGTGGLHSQDRPMEIWSTSNYGMNDNCIGYINPSSTGERQKADPFIIVHFDINSYYPSIMVEYGVAPEHMIKSVFVNLVRWMRDTRVQTKHSVEEYVNGIQREVLALVLKIVINVIYGKFAYENGDLYDRLATLKVTINGQLMMLMLCEELEDNGIRIISANTDGIMVKVRDSQWEKYKEITERWQTNTKLKADTDLLHCLIARDVNNYVAIFRTKKGFKLEYKGAMNPNMYANDLSKGYSMPIVAKAVSDYFLLGIPIMDTFRKATNILDFCMTQNVGRQFHVEQIFSGSIIKRVVCQRYVRFYISNKGCVIEKVHNDTNSSSRLAAGQVVTVINTLDDKDIALRDINYKYYYEEAMKIINPIKLGISPKKGGKTKIKKQYGAFNNLFDSDDFENIQV